ncbi:mannonate dehydratase [Lachnotalea glycerini]|uniref:Mannonate dehydratase n=1 Tax=Lachnotalea glycerini TaxID=1763509 RepID=A0A255I9R1_9FIRM|nr:enolase C-terminal domain-like protein [Lachnotalea glycerini]OYP21356.1 starvation-sensing protein RspA [Lachnotalea glycerini]PXV86874.1 mannonate dehydratase [Lachnotalea glycerini]RDY30673.1 starvation-sensing protein RspA [Lachnotalea glycerini]
MNTVTIRDIKVFVTAPHNINLVVVKVLTSEPELYGLGCATFTWRYKAVVTAIEEYLRPFLIGKNVANIEDIWQSAMGSSYWRNGPVLNNALSGVDEALWDIKGKMANMPLYDLFGGKCREGIAVYRHADGNSIKEVEEKVLGFMDQGVRYIRCHMGTYGGNFDGTMQTMVHPMNSPKGAYYSPKDYMKSVVKLLEHIRNDIGWNLEIMHDVHERLSLADTLDFAKEMEQFKLFFLEDSLAPDQSSYFEFLRKQTSVPLAMGELLTNPIEWRIMVQNQWIDFIRCHLSDIGGLTPARKLAAFCEAYQVRTAWHGPNDLSPVGMAAQMHLDYSSSNFGIQEFAGFNEEEEEVFPGCPIVKDGYAYLNDKPGIGVDFDEKASKKYPCVNMDFSWLYSRLPDGTAVRP